MTNERRICVTYIGSGCFADTNGSIVAFVTRKNRPAWLKEHVPYWLREQFAVGPYGGEQVVFTVEGDLEQGLQHGWS